MGLKMTYFTINGYTSIHNDVKNFKEGKRLSKEGIEYIQCGKNNIEYSQSGSVNVYSPGLFENYRACFAIMCNQDELKKILKLNPEMIEVFI